MKSLMVIISVYINRKDEGNELAALNRVKSKFYRERDKYIGRKRLHFLKHAECGYGINKDGQRNEKYIVSMASYAGRYHVLPMSLKSLLFQTAKPDRIIVWLDEDNPENAITEELRSLCQYGVEFRHTYHALKPHKKYLYAMREFPECNIITVDDDLVYSADLVESLMKQHSRNEGCICARRVHKITFDESGELKPYMSWKYEYREAKEPSLLLFATGGGVEYYILRDLCPGKL